MVGCGLMSCFLLDGKERGTEEDLVGGFRNSLHIASLYITSFYEY